MAVTGGLPWLSRPSIGGARPNASLRRVAANYHGIRLAVAAAPLWRAVGGYQPGFLDRSLLAGNAQAGSLEVRPGLLRAARAYGIDVQPVGLGEGLWNAGFNLRGKSGKNGECGGNTS